MWNATIGLFSQLSWYHHKRNTPRQWATSIDSTKEMEQLILSYDMVTVTMNSPDNALDCGLKSDKNVNMKPYKTLKSKKIDEAISDTSIRYIPNCTSL